MHTYRWAFRSAAIAGVAGAWLWAGAVSAADSEGIPRVVATIPPLHSLVSGVMAGVAQPTLLIEGASSPHAYAMRPAAARALASADAVFWVGPALETFLPKPLAALAGAARVEAVMDDPAIVLLHNRLGGAWDGADSHTVPSDHHDAHREKHAEEHADEHHDEHSKEHAEEHDDSGHVHGDYDPHVWLDPQNAMRIVARVAAVLTDIDSRNGPTYAANAQRLSDELMALDAELMAKLAPVRAVPFMVFHDGYQYFEARYGLNSVGAFALGPGIAPGARRVAELRARVSEAKVACVFVEPQFEPAVVKAAVDGTGARVATLDPLGAALAPGVDRYPALMRALADNLAACLGSAS